MVKICKDYEYQIKIESESHRAIIQDILFSNGIGWVNSGTNKIHTTFRYFILRVHCLWDGSYKFCLAGSDVCKSTYDIMCTSSEFIDKYSDTFNDMDLEW